MENDDFATVMEIDVIISSALSAWVATEKLPELDYLVSGVYHPRKPLNATCCSTQNCVHKVLHPSWARHFKTNDHHLHFWWHTRKRNSNKLFANTISRTGNQHAQVFATDLVGHAHSHWSWEWSAWGTVITLSAEWVPSAMTYYSTKEMIQGVMNRKLKEALCHLRRTEPFNLLLNAAVREIKELKKDFGRNMIKSKTPKWLLDNCLEIEWYIRSTTTNCI